nr:PQQ-dependent sugar dehydrogenase [Legionella jordanis]
MNKQAAFVFLLFTLTTGCPWFSVPATAKTSISVKDVASNTLNVVADHLNVPWSLDFLPDGKLLFTERSGTIKLLDLNDQNHSPKLVARINEVSSIGEGGLLGLAVHPNFGYKPFIYLYYSYSKQTHYFNKVVRFQWDHSQLSNPKTLVDEIPAAAIHNGGRLRFGPDGLLYITTGDANHPENAQNLQSLSGKILRIDADGHIPKNNPFPNSLIYSYGHRNPQGLAWDDHGQLWATEHGPRAHDEINLIKPGANYGWPEIIGQVGKGGMQTSILQSGVETWAPSGAEFYHGIFYFCGLRGQALFAFNVKTKELKSYLQNKVGRLRDIRLGPDGLFYVASNNRDGRGFARKEDDLILAIDPKQLN